MLVAQGGSSCATRHIRVGGDGVRDLDARDLDVGGGMRTSTSEEGLGTWNLEQVSGSAVDERTGYSSDLQFEACVEGASSCCWPPLLPRYPNERT